MSFDVLLVAIARALPHRRAPRFWSPSQQDAWDKADQVSYESRKPFNDRNGARCNIEFEKVGVLTLVVQKVLSDNGVDHVAMGWAHVAH